MATLDLNKFRKLDHIEFVDEVVKEYAVKLKNYDKILRVKIFQDENGKFYSRMNFSIGTKPNGSAYVSMEDNHETIEDALWEALQTSMMSFNHLEEDKSKHMTDVNIDW
ncbi:MAG TPA: hypothetical protein VIL99_01285 [Ignavibacteria bacterium]